MSNVQTDLEVLQEFIAIDVVLLPDYQMTKEAILLNKRWDGSDKMPLNKTNCLPHITLGMGAIARQQLPKVAEKLQTLTTTLPPFSMTVSGIYQIELPNGSTVFGLDYERTDYLQQLHHDTMEIVMPFLVPPTPNSIDPIRGLDPITLATIADFPKKGSGEQYRPHLTLGFGQLPSLTTITLNSTIEGLFICQLANYCTCASLLKSFPFKL